MATKRHQIIQNTKAVSAGKQIPVETVAEHMEPENALLSAKHATCGKANYFAVVCHLAIPSQRSQQTPVKAIATTILDDSIHTLSLQLQMWQHGYTEPR